MSTNAELDATLTELLRVMVSRLPPNKKLPTAVVQQLLRTKYSDTYDAAYLNSHETFITDTILKLSIEKEKATMAATEKRASSPSSSSVSEDDDDDDESEEEDEEDDEEASADSNDDDDEEDEEELGSDDDDEEDSEEDDGDDEPERKKARADELDAIAKKEQELQRGTEGTTTTTTTLAERCKAMAECLRKLSYRVRAPSESETLEAYLQSFLIEEFKKHDMDPEKYSKSDIKRYRIKREVELLQQDGASLSLDRRSRAGRGFSNVVVAPDAAAQAASTPPPPIGKQTSMFLDDE